MINHVLRRRFQPQQGWDPIDLDSAERYAAHEWAHLDLRRLDWLEAKAGPVAGKRVLDLGGGPGQYSVALARRGASVVWHDISAHYHEIADRRAAESGIDLDMSLGYLEDAEQYVARPFDLVWVRLAWRYSVDDRAFAELLLRLIAPGGVGYVDTEHWRSGGRRPGLRARLNEQLGLKLGHPLPAPGAVERHLIEAGARPLLVETDGTNDRVLFWRPPASPDLAATS